MNPVLSNYSENVEMYLITITRLSGKEKTVPLSLLAESLELSPVSVNEMCRRLQENGLLEYRPYKGVLLTEEGYRQAQFVLRCHRIWEVFLVDNLRFDLQEAHQIACQLEHDTSIHLAERLYEFLGKPPVNPEGDTIPELDFDLEKRSPKHLGFLSTGQSGIVLSIEGDRETRGFLENQGLGTGSKFFVLAHNRDTLLLRREDGRTVTMKRKLAEKVNIE